MIRREKDRSGQYPDVGWQGFVAGVDGEPPTAQVQIKDGNGPGDHQVFEISVREFGVEKAEEVKTKGDIWELKSTQHVRPGFPREATIRFKFRDGSEGYVVYGAPMNRVMHVTTASEFIARYQLKPKYVTGGLYWSASEKAFCLYQGGDKAVVKFLAAKTDAGTGAATTSGMMPKDVVLVRYCEGREFTLTHRIQDHPAS
jgi:hypothetical protein